MVYEDALQVLEEVIVPACAAVGLDPIRADGLTRAGEITEQIFRRLRDDDVVIADLTGANPNVMYELGLRHTRNKLTLQIGEYGRLPFDLNVIRTVMFSRSPHGLVQARNELTDLLRVGVEGQFDLTSATRLWNEPGRSSAGGIHTASSDQQALVGTEGDTVEPGGLLDLLADGEEQSERIVAHSEEIAALIGQLGVLAEDSTEKMAQSDAQGGGSKARLAVAAKYAEGLSGIANRLEQAVDGYVEAMTSIDAANRAIIEQLEDRPNELGDATEWALTTRRLAKTARESMGELSSMAAAMEENAKFARVLREPTRKITRALERQERATGVVDEWDRRLQSLGFPMPPDDWEPDAHEGD